MECSIADASLTIRLNPDIVDRLAAVVMEGFKAVPRRGLEVGGLLLGRVEADCVLVEDFVAVASEHLHGPSWLLSENDKTHLAAEISRVHAEAGGARVVGLYRSHTRPDFMPTAEDKALVAEYCPGEDSFFLLVKPQAGGPSTAAWFAAGRGLWEHPAEFSLRRSAAPEPARQPEMIRHRMAKVLEAAAAREAEIPTLPPAPAPPRTRKWLIPAAVLLISGIAGYALAAWWQTKPPAAGPAPLAMALRVTLENGSLHLRWDRNSPLVRNAAAGIVWIDDGEKQRRLDLRPADLTEGSIQYWPSSSEVRFRLELLASQGKTESVRAAGIPMPPTVAPNTPRLARVNFEALKPRKALARFAAAKPLRPAVPPDPAGPERGEVLVKVQVEIDSSGKVARADLVSRPSAATREFQTLALDSSRLWTFTPARSGDRRVAGKGVLSYTFGNPVLADARGPDGNNSLQKP